MENCGLQGVISLPNESYVYGIFYIIHDSYSSYHSFISVAICIIGVLANSINVIVLTRPNMITPVNVLLVTMALLDMLVMSSYLIFTIHFNFMSFRLCETTNFPYFWGLFALFHAHFSLVGHTMSLWISIVMAFVRYLSLNLQYIQRGSQFTVRQSLALVGGVFLLINVANTASYVSYEITDVPVGIIYPPQCDSILNLSQIIFIPKTKEENCLLVTVAFWITGIGFKVLPCILLALMIGLLVKQLANVRRRHLRLTHRGNMVEKRRKEPSERTTRMLITLVSVFLATELPQGLAAVASGIFSNHFRIHIYNSIGDLLDLFSLINSTVSFVIYCSMSQQFRDTFRSVICSCFSVRTSETKPLLARILPTSRFINSSRLNNV